MKHRLPYALSLALTVLTPVASAHAADAPPAVPAGTLPTADFTGSTAAGLAGTKRVAITSVQILFQTSTGARAGASFFIPWLTSRKEVQSVLAMPSMSDDLPQAIADAVYRQLSNELTAQGFEVVPEAQVTASANYQAILAQSGFTNQSRYADSMGDVLIVSPPSLKPYAPYNGEVGNFYYPSTSYLGWISGFGANGATQGGMTAMKSINAWKVPGLEVALAKELNAHVVKATYVVSLGKTDAHRSTDFSTSEHSGIFMYQGDLYAGTYRTLDRTVSGSGTATAEVGLLADQSHIAFRSPNGNAKWQKVSMTSIPPAKDGDVVVRITQPVVGSGSHFSLTEGQIPRAGGLLSSQQRGDINVGFIASITNEQTYGREVIGMIGAANKAMLGLVHQ